MVPAPALVIKHAIHTALTAGFRRRRTSKGWRRAPSTDFVDDAETTAQVAEALRRAGYRAGDPLGDNENATFAIEAVKAQLADVKAEG